MTAFATGTATSHTDLFSKLITFLTTNAALVAAGEQWEVIADHGAYEKVVRGPGLSNQDDIYVGLKIVTRPTEDEYEIQITGMSGILGESNTFDGHINTAPTHVRMFTDSGAQSFWFVASGRRFVVVTKISTVFQSMYAGLFLPYSPPTTYAYPLFIGGTAGSNGATSWRSTDAGHRHFPHSYYDGTPTLNARSPSALMMDPAGNWLRTASTGGEANIAIAPRRFHGGFGLQESYTTTNYGYLDIRQRLRAGFDGSLTLTPLTLLQSNPSDQTYGVLEGCYHVPGFNNSSENIVTVDGVNHLTIQDAFRTAVGEYWSLALE